MISAGRTHPTSAPRPGRTVRLQVLRRRERSALEVGCAIRGVIGVGESRRGCGRTHVRPRKLQGFPTGDHDRPRRRAEPGGTAPGTRAASRRVRGRSRRCARAGTTILVVGEAGVGKSMLLRELTRAAAAGHRPARAGDELEQEFPYGVVRQLLEPLSRTLQRRLGRPRRARPLGLRSRAAGRRRRVVRPSAGAVLARGQPRRSGSARCAGRRRRPPRRRALPALPALPRPPARRPSGRPGARDPARCRRSSTGRRWRTCSTTRSSARSPSTASRSRRRPPISSRRGPRPRTPRGRLPCADRRQPADAARAGGRGARHRRRRRSCAPSGVRPIGQRVRRSLSGAPAGRSALAQAVSVLGDDTPRRRGRRVRRRGGARRGGRRAAAGEHARGGPGRAALRPPARAHVRLPAALARRARRAHLRAATALHERGADRRAGRRPPAARRADRARRGRPASSRPRRSARWSRRAGHAASLLARAIEEPAADDAQRARRLARLGDARPRTPACRTRWHYERAPALAPSRRDHAPVLGRARDGGRDRGRLRGAHRAAAGRADASAGRAARRGAVHGLARGARPPRRHGPGAPDGGLLAGTIAYELAHAQRARRPVAALAGPVQHGVPPLDLSTTGAYGYGIWAQLLWSASATRRPSSTARSSSAAAPARSSSTRSRSCCGRGAPAQRRAAGGGGRRAAVAGAVRAPVLAVRERRVDAVPGRDPARAGARGGGRRGARRRLEPSRRSRSRCSRAHARARVLLAQRRPEQALAAALAVGSRAPRRSATTPSSSRWRRTAALAPPHASPPERAAARAAEHVRAFGRARGDGDAPITYAFVTRSTDALEAAARSSSRSSAPARCSRSGGPSGSAGRPPRRGSRCGRRWSSRPRPARAGWSTRRWTSSRPPARAAQARRARRAPADRGRGAGRAAGGRRREQPRDRPGALRDAQDRRDAPERRLPQARHLHAGSAGPEAGLKVPPGAERSWPVAFAVRPSSAAIPCARPARSRRGRSRGAGARGARAARRGRGCAARRRRGRGVLGEAVLDRLGDHAAQLERLVARHGGRVGAEADASGSSFGPAGRTSRAALPGRRRRRPAGSP